MSEFRQDLISGDWVIIAPGRAARPQFLDVKKPARKPSLKSTCPFEHLEKNGNWPPITAYPNEKNWRVIAIPNKFPALIETGIGHGKTCSIFSHHGIYAMRTGVGEHDLIITKDHRKNFAELDPATAVKVFEMFQALCKRAAADPCATYAAPFFNWGLAAGASIWHPHYQFISLPIVPAHSTRSLAGAKEYWAKHHRCSHCDVIAFERKEKTRIVGENEHAIAFVPYASKFPFEIRIVPKKHSSSFYKAPAGEVRAIAALTQLILRHIKRSLNDPDLNVFVHEAPVDGKPHPYHHWHAEIVPRISTPAGFEFSTGMYINIVAPEAAAKLLRKK